MFGGVNRKRSNKSYGKGKKNVNSSNAAQAAIIEIDKKRVQVERESIEEIAQGFSEILFSLGETNDEEKYTEEMTEDIFDAFKTVEKNQGHGKKKK